MQINCVTPLFNSLQTFSLASLESPNFLEDYAMLLMIVSVFIFICLYFQPLNTFLPDTEQTAIFSNPTYIAIVAPSA